ncbi:pleckstrin homology domain-containing family A member 7 isoform X14 [Diceros bicornis minor]|uniref:pleckstrin homology domain-containing family A member 7 isoform X14 n=1 Tax=Diceros bicornis minor TaxID=77932 RepID=UPI0026EC9547|nr:pleckstrin homology domain-containing family A member 7 isoform X14 [Diceros bicornis minor]
MVTGFSLSRQGGFPKSAVVGDTGQWGGGVGRGNLPTRSAPRARPSSPSLPPSHPPSGWEPAKEEVRGQLPAVDRSGFRHTFPEECGGFVPGARPSPEPRSPRAWGRGSGAITHLLWQRRRAPGHNQQTTAFRHPVSGQFSPENSEFILQDEPNPHMSKQERNQRPSSMVSETSTAGTTSTVEAKPGPKIIKSSNKVHSFGKRDQAIRRNPNVPVVVRGWLHKQDSSGMRLWKRRWFVLADYCLFYYKDSREEVVLGSIPLPSYVISPVAPEDRISRKYSFKAVHTGMRALIYNSSTGGSPAEQSGMRTYYFSADTQEDMNAWVRAMNQAAQVLSRSSLKSLPPDQTLPRQGPGQSLAFPENYQTLPKSTRHPSGGSPPPPRNLPSDYKYAQDRASHLKMSSEERRAHRDGTVWQLYEWQQRQQFRHGSPTAPICAGSPEFADQGRSRSMLEVPRSISVPPSPSDIPPPGPPRVFPPRRPHTPAERVTVKPPDQRRSVDISLGGSPRKAWGHTTKNSSHVDRRSMPSMGYMTHTVSAPSLHGKSADDTYLQLKKDLEYLDLKMTGRDLLKDRSLKPVKIAESDIDVKLSVFCEQDRILQDLEDKIRALKENKDQLESVLEVLHRQMEQYRDQPQHLEKIAYQQRLLQEDLVHIRAELSRESTEMENAWNEYLKLESDVEQLKQTLQEQHRKAFFFQEKSQIQKDLWRIEDVIAGLSANKENFRILVESVKNPERKTVPLFSHPPVPSLSTSESKLPPQPSPPTSPVRTPLEVRLFPQLQTYVPYRPHPLQLKKVTSPLQSPTKTKPKVEDEAPPRPPLPELYSPEDQPPAVPPLPREATIIRHTSVRGLKRQSDERKRDREQGQCVNGDSRVELRSYVSEPELATFSGDMAQPSLGLVGSESRYQTLPGRGLSGSTSRLQQSSTIAPYVTLRRDLNVESSKVTFPRPKSALERLYSGDHQRGKMSAEEQLERMKRHQKALVRERKRTLNQGERTGLPSSRYLSQPLPGDLGSWKREQDFDLQLLERAVQGERRDKEENGWLKVQAVPVTELDLEPQDYDLDISRELSKPEKVSIPERYIELDPEEPPSLEELQARYRKAEKIRNILARSSMCNLQPTSGQDRNSVADLDLQLQEQERIINISYALASEASQRSRQVAAQQLALLPPKAPLSSRTVPPYPPLSNGLHYTFV